MASLSYVKDLGRWRVRWRSTNRTLPKDHPKRVFSGSSTFLEQEQAIRVYGEMVAQEKLWRSGQADTMETVEHAIEQFKRFCLRWTTRTQKHYADCLQQFKASLPSNVVRTQQLTEGHYREFCYAELDRGLVARTVNSKLTPLRRFSRFCSDQYGIENQAAKVDMVPHRQTDSL